MHGLGIKLSQGGFIVNILFKGGGGGINVRIRIGHLNTWGKALLEIH